MDRTGAGTGIGTVRGQDRDRIWTGTATGTGIGHGQGQDRYMERDRDRTEAGQGHTHSLDVPAEPGPCWAVIQGKGRAVQTCHVPRCHTAAPGQLLRCGLGPTARPGSADVSARRDSRGQSLCPSEHRNTALTCCPQMAPVKSQILPRLHLWYSLSKAD